MSIINNAVEAGRAYSKGRDPSFAERHAPKSSVASCKDRRLHIRR